MSMQLRQNAEERIEKGTAPFTRGWPTGIQALTLLHGLASATETASDALKLLHELQVHQVELDLQHEQAEQDRRQLTEDLTNYTALFVRSRAGGVSANAVATAMSRGGQVLMAFVPAEPGPEPVPAAGH